MLQNRSRHTILVVEDETDLLELLVEALRFYDLEVVTAKNGSEGLQKANNQVFSMIITDMALPKIAGETLVELIRGTPFNGETPIVVYSGHLDGPRVTKLRGQILKAFTKPANLQDIAQFVAEHIGAPLMSKVEAQKSSNESS